MMKVIKYLFQSIIIYFFFIIGKIIGIRLSRNLFGYIFKKLGPLFKSKKIIREKRASLSLTQKEINEHREYIKTLGGKVLWNGKEDN